MPGRRKADVTGFRRILAGCLQLAAALTLLSACSFSQAPAGNVDFARLTRLDDFNGRFLNHGEGAPGTNPVPLSSIIWPAGDSHLNHAEIVSIEVQAIGETALQVRAIGAHGPLREQVFVAGRDFNLVDGRIRIHRAFNLLSGGAGDPLVGPRYEELEIGLDEAGHGKYKSSFTGAGLVFLMVPVAVSGTDEVRFPRIAEQ
jgi:hypothetical protein